MASLKEARRAPGAPGIEPRWTRSAKEAVGTAYSASSKVWFTLSRGILNEVYYPNIDQPQIRDLQFLVTDGKTFFADERHLVNEQPQYLENHVLGLKLVNEDPEGRFRIVKEVIANPHQSSVLINARLEGNKDVLDSLHLYVLLAPHLEIGGWGNSGYAALVDDHEILVAHKNITWLALGATVPFVKRSCGYVGATDGWRDIKQNYRLTNEYDAAENGNVALTGELDLSQGKNFTVCLAFGHGLNAVATNLFQSLGVPYEEQRQRYIEQWKRASHGVLPLHAAAGDGGDLYCASQSLLLAHEDKTYQGAMIASLSIPWGEVKGDEDLGGYHLVWTRDMVNSAGGLLASGKTATPLRALIYLACAQREDGGFYQNFWINGNPFWQGVQLDEVAFPIILAWRLKSENALGSFDPYPMALRAAGYLIRNGPATPQERWEENSGYSPSTLAAVIAGLVCAADFARGRGDEKSAAFIEEYADFLERRVETWTVTSEGRLVPGITRHYIRINPADLKSPHPDEDPDSGTIPIRNQPPGARAEFPANEIVDAGFLELVRYGIRKPGDRIVEDSLKVIDALLKVDTPFGPCWRRYNHDGYGQCEDGSPYKGAGKGRAWPLLTGERGHYELACGRDTTPYVRAMEKFAIPTKLLPEQIWDGPDLPKARMRFGYPTGAAMPLMWAHAEYVKLLRSRTDGRVFDLIPPVADRYLKGGAARKPLEVWKFNRQPRAVRAGETLRVIAGAPFALRWTRDEWRTSQDSRSIHTSLGSDYFDIPAGAAQKSPIKFTFHWLEENRWEGKDFQVLTEGSL